MIILNDNDWVDDENCNISQKHSAPSPALQKLCDYFPHLAIRSYWNIIMMSLEIFKITLHSISIHIFCVSNRRDLSTNPRYNNEISNSEDVLRNATKLSHWA